METASIEECLVYRSNVKNEITSFLQERDIEAVAFPTEQTPL